MYTIFAILIIICCVLLVLVVLVQNPKGGGLATGFSGTASVGGVQKTADFLEKSTWYLVIALFVLCLLSAKFSSTANLSGGDDDQQEEVIEEADEEEVSVVPENTSIEEMLEGGNTDESTDETP